MNGFIDYINNILPLYIPLLYVFLTPLMLLNGVQEATVMIFLLYEEHKNLQIGNIKAVLFAYFNTFCISLIVYYFEVQVFTVIRQVLCLLMIDYTKYKYKK